MNVSGKNIVRAGALAGALAAIAGVFVGAVSFARPYMQSDDPPLASQARVQGVEKHLQVLVQFQQSMQSQMMLTQRNQLFLAEGFWENQLAMAQNELRIHPNNGLARQQMIRAQQQLSGIQQQIFGH